jgi:hypothetical protein
MSSLPSGREAAPVAQSSIRADVHEPLDIHGNRLAEISFNHPVSLDNVPDTNGFIFGQVLHLGINIDGGLLTNLGCPAFADAEYVCQTNLNPFI